VPVKKTIYEPSPKYKQVFRESNLAKFRLLEGAVRSGKSYVTNDIAIDEIQQLPPCDVLISGYTISSVARNVLAEWREMIDPYGYGLFKNVREGKDDYLTIDWRGLRGKKFYIRGAGKDNDFKQIQGATFGYWLADEAVRHTESFVDMAISRLSLSFAKSIWTMNPDSPFHFIKKRFLDKEELYKEDSQGYSEFKKWTFFLEDNPSLSSSYIDQLSNLYSGVFYKRYILSMWVIAEGAIYDFFMEADHTFSRQEMPKAIRYVTGSDYGTGNPTCFLLFGINPKSHPSIWAEREYYYDSKIHEAQKTDTEYSKAFRKFLDGIRPSTNILDPSAASFKLQLKKDGVLFVKDADNDVLNGLRTQARMLKSREYMICRDTCPQTVKDYAGYSWDERAQLLGEDKPLKLNDHTKDTERYVLHTLYGRKRLIYEALTRM